MPASLSSSSIPAGLPCLPGEVDEFISRPTPAVVEVLARTPGPFVVLGAGGKIGLHLSAMLRRGLDQLGRKDRVLAVSRFSSLRDTDDFARFGIETRAADLSDPAAVAALPDAPTVFFLAGVKFGTSAASNLLHAINVELPRRVAQRYARSKIIAYSTGCVYPFVTPESGGAREETPMEPIGDYAASCVAREEAFMAIAAEHRTPVSLIRLNYSVELRYGLLGDIAQKIIDRRPIDVTTGHVNVIWQTDAVAHSIQALDIAGAPAVPINITGPGTLAVRDLAKRFGEILGLPVEIVGKEAPTAWLNNAARSHQLFGMPLTSLDQMMLWTAQWLRANGETWGKPTGFERRDGRF